MPKLKTLVKKYANDPETFDYDLFRETSGLSLDDNVSTKDALIAFDAASSDLNRCYTSRSRILLKQKEQESSNQSILNIAFGIGALWLIRKTLF